MAHRPSRSRLTCVIALLGFGLASPALAQTSEEEDAPGKPTLDRLAFLAGTWQAEVNGGFVEEVWSAPHAGAMMGMFRWVRPDGTPSVYEILTISQEGDEVLMRLRHFSAAMVAWEERDAPLVLRLEDHDASSASFVNVSEEGRLDRYAFELAGPDALRIEVTFREESGATPLHFDLCRAPCP